jgi:hypothetical protein
VPASITCRRRPRHVWCCQLLPVVLKAQSTLYPKTLNPDLPQRYFLQEAWACTVLPTLATRTQ